MMSWKLIIDIGHTSVMLPVASAIAAWLLAGGARKRAIAWCLMFAAGLSLVAMSKIAFLGWQTAIPALQFKALSGHALCSTAVLPVLFFVVLQEASIALRTAGVVFGYVLSIALGVLLVHFRFHSVAEVIPSFVLGSSISLGYIRFASRWPAPRISQRTVPLSVLVFILIFTLKPAVINYRLKDVAVHLSGRDRPFEWRKKSSICKVRTDDRRG
jgi:hypothetical protein